jgi:hypothetical protein
MVTGIALALMLLMPQRGQGVEPERLEALVNTHLGLFLMVPERRDAGERVVLRGGRLEIWFLRPIGRADRAHALCDGARWLLSGRLAATQGVGALFRAAPAVTEVTLVFYTVDTRVEPGGDGRYRQFRTAAPTARFRVGRDRASGIDPALARTQLTGDACAKRAERLLDEVWAR